MEKLLSISTTLLTTIPILISGIKELREVFNF
jgi:hypothetical protein